ncbi:MAG: allophanate hydrolase subunit 1 [Chloroflexota bacterium]|nr:carboxyltransferase domain-containing protein [Chloroflexota bacterium]MDE3101960.1 allophanate hydrolase subunit 1 [Chloroflexota bacterium]
MPPRLVRFGEAALLVELEQRIDPLVAARAAEMADRWESLGLGMAVPTYASVLLRWDPLALGAAEAERAARGILASSRGAIPFRGGRVIEVPTRYDGPDREDVAHASGLSVEELVRAHTSRDHLAYFIGFMPGFAYCAGIDERIVAPRLASPRSRVPAGSVAVADGQTAVYPADSPGGWRILGHTELVVFDAVRDEPALIRPGDRLRFVAL